MQSRRETESVAAALKVKLHYFAVQNTNDVETLFGDTSTIHADVVFSCR